MFFNEIDIVPAVFGKLIKATYPAYIALPAGESLINRLCLVKERRDGEVFRLLPVDLVSRTYGDLIEIAKDIEDREDYLGRALQAAAVS